MKKFAFLLAPVTGITVSCLFAFLIALGIVVIGVGEVLNPAPPTPTLSTTASILVTNTQLRVSFRQPEGWTLIDSGTVSKGPFRLPYATYGLKGQPHAPTFTVTKDDFGVPISQDHLVDTVTRSSQQHGAYIVEELRVTIHAVPAGGVRYIKKGEVGLRLIASQFRQTNDFEWTSDVEYIDELEQIYRAMLPTIRIEPPPP